MAKLIRIALVLIWTTAPPVCLAGEWEDPAGDTLPGISPPALDLVHVSTRCEPGTFIVELEFESSTLPTDLQQLGGVLEFDVDQNSATGGGSHYDDIGLVPPPPIGIEYYFDFIPYFDMGDLTVVINQEVLPVGLFPVSVDGTRVTVSLPRSETLSTDGIFITARYNMAVLIRNATDATDVAPYDGVNPLVFTNEPAPADFDEDCDVDVDDYQAFEACASGPAVPVTPECAGKDLDGDGDADHADFAIFQASMTGAF